MSAPILCYFTAGKNNSGQPYPSIRMKLVPDWSLTCEYYMFFSLIDVIGYIICSLSNFQLLQVLKKEIAAIKIGEIAGWQKCLLFELTYSL